MTTGLTKPQRRALAVEVMPGASVHALVVALRANRRLGIAADAYDGATVRALLRELGLTVRPQVRPQVRG